MNHFKHLSEVAFQFSHTQFYHWYRHTLYAVSLTLVTSVIIQWKLQRTEEKITQ
jgi:hypothetical protein